MPRGTWNEYVETGDECYIYRYLEGNRMEYPYHTYTFFIDIEKTMFMLKANSRKLAKLLGMD